MKKLHKHIGLIAGTASVFALAPQAQAAENPFSVGASGETLLVAAADNHKKGISVLEGKCGSGKCGSVRIRQMMDRNGDGRINRDEYVNWAATQAATEYDDLASGAASISADDVFKSFLEFQELTQQG